MSEYSASLPDFATIYVVKTSYLLLIRLVAENESFEP